MFNINQQQKEMRMKERKIKLSYSAPAIIPLHAEFSGIICVSGSSASSTSDPLVSMTGISNRYTNGGSQSWN